MPLALFYFSNVTFTIFLHLRFFIQNNIFNDLKNKSVITMIIIIEVIMIIMLKVTEIIMIKG